MENDDHQGSSDSENEEEAEEDSPLLPRRPIENINNNENNENNDTTHSGNTFTDPAPEINSFSVTKPSLCGCGWFTCYFILGTMAVILLGGAFALYFIPNTSIAPVLVYVPDLVYIPLPKPTQFLTDVYLQSNGSCKGTLYQVPCDKVNISYNSSYVPTNKHQYNHWDHIYCLNNSVFVFNMRQGHNASDEEVWVFTDYYAKHRRRDNYGPKTDCNNPPSGSYCRQMVNDTASIPVILPEAMIGQYYYVLNNPATTTFYVKRYYYNYTAVDYAPYEVGLINPNTALRVHLRKRFHPIDVHKSLMCMLMHVTYDYYNDDLHYVTITTNKRKDLFLWNGIALTIDITLIILLIIVHIIIKIRQKAEYERSRQDAGPI